MLPYVRGDAVWVDSLLWCVEQNRDAAATMIRDALLNVLAFPWSDNEQAWARFWPRASKHFDLDCDAAGKIAGAVAEPLATPWDAVPDGRSERAPHVRAVAKEERAGRDRILASMVAHGLAAAEVEALWRAWSAQTGTIPPWIAFKGRISNILLAEWATATLGSQGYHFNDPPDATEFQRQARACMQFLLEQGDAAALEELMKASDRFGSTALIAMHRLVELGDDATATAVRVRVAGQRRVHLALMLVRDLEPGPAAATAWTDLVERTADSTDLEPAALLALLPGNQRPWDVLAGRLAVLAAQTDPGHLVFNQFTNIISAFYRARALKIAGLSDILLKLWKSPWRMWTTEFPAFVRLCWEVLGERMIVGLIRTGAGDGDKATADLLKKLLSAGFAATVVSLVNDPELHDAAVAALTDEKARWPGGTAAAVLSTVDPMLASGSFPFQGSALESLSSAAVRHDEHYSVAWLSGRIPQLASATRRRWVEIGLGVVQAPSERARVLRWLAG
jgi:hypothetical protein